jgi:hypothetical protein
MASLTTFGACKKLLLYWMLNFVARPTKSKIAKFCLGVILLVVGGGICLHPIPTDTFSGGILATVPARAVHLSSAQSQLLGATIMIFGFGFLYSAFYGSKQ